MRKISAASSILQLLLVATASHASLLMGQSEDRFTKTGNMTVARAEHTATLLLDGKVLIAGGAQEVVSGPGLPLASAELYDPSMGTFAATGNMLAARRSHAAILLANGQVLITGGYGTDSSDPLASAELYDPSTGTFTATGDMTMGQLARTGTLLRDGRVLIAGFPVAQLYDPESGAFASVAYAGTFYPDTATLLPNGMVLVTGGAPDTLPSPSADAAELYDPGTGTFKSTGYMTGTSIGAQTASPLINGRVLVAGGGTDFQRLAGAGVYDPSTGTFTATGSMAMVREWHTGTLLPDGTVLVAGGESEGCTNGICQFIGSVANTELYDPSTGTFAAAANMSGRREVHTATLLVDGRVLVAGGLYYGGIGIFYGSLSSAELYTPALLKAAPVLFSLSGDGRGQGAIWHATTRQAASANDPAVAGEALSMYAANMDSSGAVPPQVAVGGKPAVILYFGNAPGYPGFNQVNFLMPSGAAPGTAISVRLTYLARPSNEVTIGVR